eukprot:scaffold83789_cov63-Phaeocystis_antarctica.AAC.11
MFVIAHRRHAPPPLQTDAASLARTVTTPRPRRRYPLSTCFTRALRGPQSAFPPSYGVLPRCGKASPYGRSGLSPPEQGRAPQPAQSAWPPP